MHLTISAARDQGHIAAQRSVPPQHLPDRVGFGTPLANDDEARSVDTVLNDEPEPHFEEQAVVFTSFDRAETEKVWATAANRLCWVVWAIYR